MAGPMQPIPIDLTAEDSSDSEVFQPLLKRRRAQEPRKVDGADSECIIIDDDNDNDDDDDDVAINRAPSTAWATAVAEPGGATAAASADTDTDSDVEVVREEGQVITRDLPHPRPDCYEHRFRKPDAAGGGNAANARFCNQCYCYVCDVKASECKFWGTGEGGRDHANAFNRRIWNRLRIAARETPDLAARRELLQADFDGRPPPPVAVAAKQPLEAIPAPYAPPGFAAGGGSAGAGAGVAGGGGARLWGGVGLLHMRPHCPIYPFRAGARCVENWMSCPMCVCCGCGSLARDCRSWGSGLSDTDHANRLPRSCVGPRPPSPAPGQTTQAPQPARALEPRLAAAAAAAAVAAVPPPPPADATPVRRQSRRTEYQGEYQRGVQGSVGSAAATAAAPLRPSPGRRTAPSAGAGPSSTAAAAAAAVARGPSPQLPLPPWMWEDDEDMAEFLAEMLNAAQNVSCGVRALQTAAAAAAAVRGGRTPISKGQIFGGGTAADADGAADVGATSGRSGGGNEGSGRRRRKAVERRGVAAAAAPPLPCEQPLASGVTGTAVDLTNTALYTMSSDSVGWNSPGEGGVVDHDNGGDGCGGGDGGGTESMGSGAAMAAVAAWEAGALDDDFCFISRDGGGSGGGDGGGGGAAVEDSGAAVAAGAVEAAATDGCCRTRGGSGGDDKRRGDADGDARAGQDVAALVSKDQQASPAVVATEAEMLTGQPSPLVASPLVAAPAPPAVGPTLRLHSPRGRGSGNSSDTGGSGGSGGSGGNGGGPSSRRRGVNSGGAGGAGSGDGICTPPTRSSLRLRLRMPGQIPAGKPAGAGGQSSAGASTTTATTASAASASAAAVPPIPRLIPLRRRRTAAAVAAAKADTDPPAVLAALPPLPSEPTMAVATAAAVMAAAVAEPSAH